MRVLLFFDLPTLTIVNKRNYIHFRKTLIENGFFMLQQSVYCKIALNMTNVDTIMRILEDNKPNEGFIQILVVTEKQYEKMITLLGEFESETLNTDERLVIL